MIMKAIVLLGMCVALASCQPAPMLSDEDRCEDYGFDMGTVQFAQCRMMLDQQRQSVRDAVVGQMLINRLPR